MRKAFLIILLSIGFQTFSQVQWRNPIDVALSNFGNVRPIVKLINDTTPVAIWSSSVSDEVYFSKWDGTQFSFPIQINGSADNVMVYNWAGAEMSTVDDNIFVTFRTNPWSSGYSYLVKSTDGGTTWSDTMHVEPSNYGKKTYFPTITALSENQLTITYMHHDGNENDPQYSRIISTDGGDTFSDTLDISRQFGAEACDCCSPMLIGNDSTQLIAFRNNDNNIREFKGLLSEDGGLTFNREIVLDTLGWVVNACPSSTISGVLFDNYSLTTYMSDGEIYLAKSDLTTGNLNSLEFVSNQAITKNYPKIAANQDSAIIVWEQNGNNNDLYYTMFDPDLSNFDANNAAVLIDSSGHQSKPSIAYASDGTIHIVYTDASTGTVKYINNRPVEEIDGLQVEQIKSIKIFPNPASDYIQTNIESIENVVAFDETGKSTRLDFNNNLIEVNSLSNGAYMLVIQSNGHFYRGEFIKE